MVVGEMPEAVDLLVLGAGPGGYVAALRAADLGREVTLVDRGEFPGPGGTCLHVGCIPSKALIEVADTVDRLRQLEAAGVHATDAGVDLARFQSWKRERVSTLVQGVGALLARRGVRLVSGEARFTKPGRVAVEVGGDSPPRFFEYRHAVVATGSRPVAVPGLPVDGVRVLDSTGALALEHVPPVMTVVGGGYIGVELGTAFAKLGSRVTIVEALPRLLGGFGADLVQPVLRGLRRLGVEVLTSATVEGLDGESLAVQVSGVARRVPAGTVVVACGRSPVTDGLGLDTLGARLGPDGRVEVDAARLAAPDVAAIGDITAGPALAHKATAEAAVAVSALSGRPARFEPSALPVVAFTDPELAVTGMTEEQARAAGLDVTVGTFPFAASGRAATAGARDGFVRLVVDRDADVVVGAELVGRHASELVAEATLAIEMGAGPDDLALTIHTHPTLAETLAEAAELAAGHPLHLLA